MRPKASATMLMIPKWTGSMPAVLTIGSSTVPTMMIAGIASRKQPTARNTPAMTKPIAAGPRLYAAMRADQRLRNLAVGEQPAEHRRGAEAEKRDRRERAGLEQHRLQFLPADFAVDDRRQEQARRAPPSRRTRSP